jgi:4-hydroxy-tetrahydrodipicolinate reductase
LEREVLVEKIKVIQMGIGTVGQAATRSLVKKRGLDVVGALDLDKEKVGKDLGEVAGLGKKLGVIVTDDADSLFPETYADVVIHTVCVYLHEAYPQIIKPIQQGMNVISSSEALGNPYVSDPGLAAKLDKLAKKHGVTVLGSGLSPGFTSDYLILALTGVCSEVCKIRYARLSDVRRYLGGTVGRHFGLGLSPEEFKRGVAEGEIIGHIGFIESVQTVADRLGWQLDEIKRTMEPVHDHKGQFVSTKTVVQGIRDGEVKIELELEAFIDPKMETMDSITIEGIPPINMVIKPVIPGIEGTANALVNAIPHVINAKPGIMTPGDLPLIFALENDLRMFLK